MYKLKDKVIIVTGAAGGIGSSITERFCNEGSNVIGFDINCDDLKKCKFKYSKYFSNLIFKEVDITNYNIVKESVKDVINMYGRIDVLVNNAGYDIVMKFSKTNINIWKKIVKVNFFGVLNLHHIVLPEMVKQKNGKIINISSDAGRVGASGEAVYSACKGGIISFSKSIAREYAKYNINVNVVSPGPTDTKLLNSLLNTSIYSKKIYRSLKLSIPFKRFGVPNDISGIVAFLSSNESNFITGQVVSVSGGLTMHG